MLRSDKEYVQEIKNVFLVKWQFVTRKLFGESHFCLRTKFLSFGNFFSMEKTPGELVKVAVTFRPDERVFGEMEMFGNFGGLFAKVDLIEDNLIDPRREAILVL